ncbi:hypothetical protein [Chthonobacter rhizosphaerae]|uniref:hypothetical protein n=1 Tax=Chthonobacter rhizosphaerae TaxID=2735553 RepID=UPI0015EE3E8D|nr:hypothetical protein [Chthonobacter rhizosphaerae]
MGATVTEGDAANRILFDREVDGLAARAVAGRGSDVLAVVFSQVRVPRGRYGLSRLFARTAHPCLFLNQPEAIWYRGAEDAVDAAIREAAGRSGAARVVLYGSSMGAFGALAAAARWPGAEAIVYAPDGRIGEAGSQSAAAGLPPRSGEPSLEDLLATRAREATTVITGLFDPYDAGVASRLAPLAEDGRVRLLPVLSGHEVHDHLYALNVVRRIISTFRRDPGAEIAARGLAARLDPGRHGRFAALAAALRSSDPPHPDAVRALAMPDNPGVALLEASALEARGDLDGAERRLADVDGVIGRSPILSTLPKRYRKIVPRRRIDLLDRLGRRAEADALAREAAARFSEDADFAARAGAGCQTGTDEEQ